jgi:hypothetical protein
MVTQSIKFLCVFPPEHVKPKRMENSFSLEAGFFILDFKFLPVDPKKFFFRKSFGNNFRNFFSEKILQNISKLISFGDPFSDIPRNKNSGLKFLHIIFKFSFSLDQLFPPVNNFYFQALYSVFPFLYLYILSPLLLYP